MNCIDILFEQDKLLQDRPGIIYFDNIDSLKNPNKNISFREFGIQLGRAQKKLIEMNIQIGDAALLFELPSPALFAVITAMLAMGVKVLLVEPWLPVGEINHIIEKIKPKIFVRKFTGRIFAFKVASIRKIPFHLSSEDFLNGTSSIQPFSIPVEADHIGILTFTSGTTGRSKGVARTHQYLIDQRNVISKYINYQNLNKLDLTVFTNLTLMNLALGKGSLIIPKWKPSILRDLNKLPTEFLPDTIASGPYFLELLKNCITNNLLVFDTIKVGGALSGVKQMEEIQKKFNPKSFYHVYGSTEAEPVAISSMKESIENSRARNFYHCLYLGKSIPEIRTLNQETLWVAGAHVSSYYLDDLVSNEKNKKLINGEVYHNMGDRIDIDENSDLWYRGRDFQEGKDFILEQNIYMHLESSEGFIGRIGNNIHFVTSLRNEQTKRLKETFKEIDHVNIVKEIFKDRRHMSRIDRHKTLSHFKIVKKKGH